MDTSDSMDTFYIYRRKGKEIPGYSLIEVACHGRDVSVYSYQVDRLLSSDLCIYIGVLDMRGCSF